MWLRVSQTFWALASVSKEAFSRLGVTLSLTQESFFNVVDEDVVLEFLCMFVAWDILEVGGCVLEWVRGWYYCSSTVSLFSFSLSEVEGSDSVKDRLRHVIESPLWVWVRDFLASDDVLWMRTSAKNDDSVDKDARWVVSPST